MKTKVIVKVAIFLNVPTGKHSFGPFEWGVKTKRVAMEAVFEKTFDEHIQIGSLMQLNVWGPESRYASTIKMAPMFLVKEEFGEGMQSVTATLSIDGLSLFPSIDLITRIVMDELNGPIQRNMNKEGFVRVSEAQQRPASESERISPFESY